MGTNYYLSDDACDKCGRSDEPLHIGKSSAGWCFALHVIPEDGINTLEDWKAKFAAPGAVIRDEYGHKFSADEMLLVITNRKAAHPPKNFDYVRNNAEVGPNNLIRHAFRAQAGEGTWDYVEGEFS